METFETYRPLLFSIAYRMLGSVMEAEDMVQETYLRCQTMRAADIKSPRAFYSTVLTRLCLNRLESAQHRREQYIGPWLPEPLLTDDDPKSSPVEQPILHESISMAFLVLLEQLTPQERAVFLLRQVFDYEYAEIAEMIGKDETTCRQLLSRAKKHVAEHRPRFPASREQHVAMLNEFLRAVEQGELEGLMGMLTHDVTMTADGGGKARGAATKPLHGPEAVARFMMATTRFATATLTVEISEVNGEPAAVLRIDNHPTAVLFIETEGQRIHAIRAIANPDKLTHV